MSVAYLPPATDSATYNMGVTDRTVEAKRELRARVRAGRAALSEDQRAADRAALTVRLSDLVHSRGARSLSCFLPVRNEPDTRGFLDWAHEQGIEVLLPAARADGLLDWIRPSGDGTVKGAFGIDEPLGEHLGPQAVAAVDLMLIPAAAVDRRGNRLGWGRGYFDRCLASIDQHPPIFAVIYEDELVEHLPAEAHDIPVTGVVTPQRIVTF